MKTKGIFFVTVILLLIFSENANAQWFNNGGNVFTFDRVGIGIPNPTYQLQINTPRNKGFYWRANWENLRMPVGAPMILETNVDYRGRGLFLPHRDVSDNSPSAWFVGVPYSGNGFQIGNSTERSIDSVNSGAYKAYAKLFIHEDGNVGMGTAAPKTRLHIAYKSKENLPKITGNKAFGGIHIEQKGGRDHYVGITTDAQGYPHTTQGGMLIQGSGLYGTKIHFLTTDNYRHGMKQRMIIDHKGNVGVGITDIPSGYKMAVDGKLLCEEVRVEMSQNWPDYVFEKDYDLMPLDKLAKHIETEKHLPGIPSASEVSKEGVALGDMQKKMMEKIEELTLYILQQQKAIEALQQK